MPVENLTGRALAFAVGCALVLGASACGGSDDERQQVRSAIDRLYDGYREEDPEKVCSVLSEEAREQVRQGDLGGEGVECTESIEKLIAQSEPGGGLKRTLKAKVLSIKVNDDRAIARMSFGAQKAKMPLVKVDGDWKVAAVQ